MKARLAICCGVIGAGLGLRLFGFSLGLPAFIVKYGGSLLWATMVYFLVALAGAGRSRTVVVAILIATLVEAFRLVHTPWLDAFRLTLPGALLLGRIFSLWNIVAYVAGVLLAALVDQAVDHPGGGANASTAG